MTLHVAFILPDDWTAWLFYRHLIATLQSQGASVTVLGADTGFANRLAQIGARFIPVPYARFISPVQDTRLFLTLRSVLARERFDVVQNFTIKANLYGAHAAHQAGVPHIINTVEGAGILYAEPLTPRLRLVRRIVESGLRSVRPYVKRYWFVNDADRDTFVRRDLAHRDQADVLIATGVDTGYYDPQQVSAEAVSSFRSAHRIEPDALVVALVAGRLLRSKGVGEFIALARNLADRPGTRALLVGPEEPDNSDAFPRAPLAAAIHEGIIRHTGFMEDVRTAYAAADVVVVPTAYAEGTPKGVMEGASMQKPIVCSDVPSTRSMVDEGRHALFVPPRDASALTRTVRHLLDAPERRSELARAARQLAVRSFDAHALASEGVRRFYHLSAAPLAPAGTNPLRS